MDTSTGVHGTNYLESRKMCIPEPTSCGCPLARLLLTLFNPYYCRIVLSLQFRINPLGRKSKVIVSSSHDFAHRRRSHAAIPSHCTMLLLLGEHNSRGELQ